jgi:hypothetical protein
MITDKSQVDAKALEKIENRMEFKIRFETLEVWNHAVKDDRDFRILINGIKEYCENLVMPDFKGAKDQALLLSLFKMEAERQSNQALKYARTCINRGKARKKGWDNPKNTNVYNSIDDYSDNVNDIDSDSDIEDIDIESESETASLAFTGSSPSQNEDTLPDNFWEDTEGNNV